MFLYINYLISTLFKILNILYLIKKNIYIFFKNGKAKIYLIFRNKKFLDIKIF